MAREQAEKGVLVRYGERSRSVTFTSGSESDSDLLLKEVVKTFDDQMPKSTKLFLQIKEEEWGGEFVDVSRTQSIPDRSVLKVVMQKVSANNIVGRGMY